MLKQFEDKMQKSLDSMTNDFVKKQNKTGELNEDQAKDEEDKVQKMTDKYIKQIDEAVEAKSKEIMTV